MRGRHQHYLRARCTPSAGRKERRESGEWCGRRWLRGRRKKRAEGEGGEGRERLGVVVVHERRLELNLSAKWINMHRSQARPAGPTGAGNERGSSMWIARELATAAVSFRGLIFVRGSPQWHVIGCVIVPVSFQSHTYLVRCCNPRGYSTLRTTAVKKYPKVSSTSSLSFPNHRTDARPTHPTSVENSYLLSTTLSVCTHTPSCRQQLFASLVYSSQSSSSPAPSHPQQPAKGRSFAPATVGYHLQAPSTSSIRLTSSGAIHPRAASDSHLRRHPPTSSLSATCRLLLFLHP